MSKLANKTALVTGGTRGIGRAIALAFAREGARVALTGTRLEGAQAAAAEITAELGLPAGAVVGYALDVKDTAAVAATVQQVIKDFDNKLDILVNNAGVTRDSLVMRLSEDDWDVVVDTDLKGVYNTIRAAARTMLGAKSGRIINISSVVGLMGNPGQANYAAAKAGVIGMTKAVAREFASRNITVNAIAPGYVCTDMTDVMKEDAKEKMLAGIPMGRPANPAEIAATALFLASDDAAYITGQTIAVDGGLTMY